MKEKSNNLGEALDKSNQRLTHIDQRLDSSKAKMQKNSNELEKILRK